MTKAAFPFRFRSYHIDIVHQPCPEDEEVVCSILSEYPPSSWGEGRRPL
jgi:hypothetical protein